MSDALRTWMEGYIRAWGTNGPTDIGSLFADDARYFTAPWRSPWEGREAIVDGWLGRKDEQGDWRFRWEPVASDGNVHVVRGKTEYVDRATYHNLWVIRLDDDGRCREFIEWWTEER